MVQKKLKMICWKLNEVIFLRIRVLIKCKLYKSTVIIYVLYLIFNTYHRVLMYSTLSHIMIPDTTLANKNGTTNQPMLPPWLIHIIIT